MNETGTRIRGYESLFTLWLARYSVSALCISLGLVFLGFGVLKFFPNLSPAQNLAEETLKLLTFGLIPGGVGLMLVATLESAIGLSLITGRYLRIGLLLLAVELVGILSPLVLLHRELLPRHFYAPTLEAQYVLKDVILVGAGLVIASSVGGGRVLPARSSASTRLRVKRMRLVTRSRELPETATSGVYEPVARGLAARAERAIWYSHELRWTRGRKTA